MPQSFLFKYHSFYLYTNEKGSFAAELLVFFWKNLSSHQNLNAYLLHYVVREATRQFSGENLASILRNLGKYFAYRNGIIINRLT